MSRLCVCVLSGVYRRIATDAEITKKTNFNIGSYW